MVYWIEHWTDILEVLGSNPSVALLKLNFFTKIFHFFKFFKNLSKKMYVSEMNFDFINMGSKKHPGEVIANSFG